MFFLITLSTMHSKILKNLVSIFPPLTGKNVKGDCGRICVIGGSY